MQELVDGLALEETAFEYFFVRRLRLHKEEVRGLVAASAKTTGVDNIQDKRVIENGECN